jgi:multidrug transporter EmrE-like cation transporter
MKTLSFAILSIALSVAAQFSLKAGMSSGWMKTLPEQSCPIKVLFHMLMDRYILGGFFLYGLGAVVWLGVLSEWDVSKAYPLVGLGFVLTVIIGFLAGEQVAIPRVIGVTLICAGVFLVGRS